MLRVLSYLVIIMGFVGCVVWLLDRPGEVTLNWQGYRIDTSVAVLVAGFVVIAIGAALIYRLWVVLLRTPSRIEEAWNKRRKTRGYKALTQGMVAVAAGDSLEAGRQVKLAEVLLDEPPLTLLLSAQAAQLNGDDASARHFFEEMTLNTETVFLGLRGLLTQAIKAGDNEESLNLARRAYKLQPKSDWVSEKLFSLQVRGGNWLDAQVTSDEQVRLGITDRSNNRRRKARLMFQHANDLKGREDAEEAQKYYKIAFKVAPHFAPIVVAHADGLSAAGKKSRAIDILVKAWVREPHPELVRACWRIKAHDDDLNRVKITEVMTSGNKDHPESQIALAEVYLAASLWGEARDQLLYLADNVEEARVCRLWADLEEAEHGDTDASRDWLRRAAVACSDPTWLCESCGNAVADWMALCASCGGFDTFYWGRPQRVQRLNNLSHGKHATDAREVGAPLNVKKYSSAPVNLKKA